jgi:hypothetical protein
MTESCYIPIKRIQKEICQIIWDDTSGALNSLEQPNRIALPAPSPTGPWMELPKKYWRYHWIGYGWIWIGFSIGYKWEKKEYTTWIYIYYNNNSNNIYMYIMYIYIILCIYIYYVYIYIMYMHIYGNHCKSIVANPSERIYNWWISIKPGSRCQCTGSYAYNFYVFKISMIIELMEIM